MLGTRTTQLTSIVFAVLLVTSMAAPAIAASNSNDQGFLDGVSDTADTESRLDAIKSFASTVPDFVSGVYARVSYWSSQQNPFADDDTETTAASEARDVQTYFNNHSQSFVSYVNNRSAGGTGYDVWKLTITKDDASETLYLVATYNNTSNAYETAEMVNNTSRTVDETVTLEGYAAVNAREELEYFHEEFVTTDKPVSKAYERKLAGKYWRYVDSSLMDGDS